MCHVHQLTCERRKFSDQLIQRYHFASFIIQFDRMSWSPNTKTTWIVAITISNVCNTFSSYPSKNETTAPFFKSKHQILYRFMFAENETIISRWYNKTSANHRNIRWFISNWIYIAVVSVTDQVMQYCEHEFGFPNSHYQLITSVRLDWWRYSIISSIQPIRAWNTGSIFWVKESRFTKSKFWMLSNFIPFFWKWC